MALDASILDALLASGATAEMIVAAVKAEAEIAREKRARETARKAKQRAELRGDQVPQSLAKSQGLDGTKRDSTGLDPSLAKEGPHTPKKTQPSPSSLRSEDQTREAAFLEFKAAYPRKPGAPWQAAREKLFRLLRDGEDRVAIIEGTKQFAASKVGEDPQFICAPTVFLNQRRWLDDHEPASAKPRVNGARAGPTSPKKSAVSMWYEDLVDDKRRDATAENQPATIGYRA